MKFSTLSLVVAGAAAAIQPPQALLENDASAQRIPTSYESAVMGRRILALTKLATFSTVFPEAKAQGRRPAGLEGVPIGLMDYIADCEDQGNPTILALSIGTTFRNVKAGSNITVSLQWAPPYPPTKRISFLSRLSAYIPFMGTQTTYQRGLTSNDGAPDTVPYSAANLPRFSLVGYLEKIEGDAAASKELASCYTAKHPDAKYWLPGNHIHTSEWTRMIVTSVYWIGGFGDRAYIGWIPIEEWKSVTPQEWHGIQLPGEKPGWNEWRLDESSEL